MAAIGVTQGQVDPLHEPGGGIQAGTAQVAALLTVKAITARIGVAAAQSARQEPTQGKVANPPTNHDRAKASARLAFAGKNGTGRTQPFFGNRAPTAAPEQTNSTAHRRKE